MSDSIRLSSLNGDFESILNRIEGNLNYYFTRNIEKLEKLKELLEKALDDFDGDEGFEYVKHLPRIDVGDI